jgi:hypothetical protein
METNLLEAFPNIDLVACQKVAILSEQILELLHCTTNTLSFLSDQNQSKSSLK